LETKTGFLVQHSAIGLFVTDS